MKKYYYSLFAAVSLLLAVTSCSQEEDFPKSSNGVTSFSISLDGAVGSRTAGDGKTADKLFYEVYLDGESVHKGDTGEEVISLDKPFNLDLPLLNGETYSIVFWAQNKDCSIYKLDNLNEISIDYQNATLLANQESYDAFYNALVDFKADGNTHKVELRRPFAQLNLGTSDWAEVVAALPSTGNVPVTATSVKVTGLADKFFPLTGVATGNDQTPVEATFGYANLINETFSVNDVAYQYLSLNYLLVPGTKTPNGTGVYEEETDDADKALVDLTFNLKRGETELQPIKVTNAPMRRNWRTNIIGDVLTGTSFDIVIEHNPDNDNNDIRNIDGIKALEDAMKAHGDSESSVTYYVNGLSTLDEVEVEIPDNFVANNVTFIFNNIKDGAELTVKEVASVAAEGRYAGKVYMQIPNLKKDENQKLASTTITLPKATIELAEGNWGNLTGASAPNTIIIGEGAIVETLEVKAGNVEVHGTVSKIKPAEGNTQTIIVTLSENANVTTIEESIIVRTDVAPEENDTEYFAQVGKFYYKSLADAVKGIAETGEIKILKDYSYQGSVTVPTGKNITLDLNNCTVSGISTVTGQNYDMIDVRGTLTVKNGTLTAEFKGANMGWSNSTNVFNITAGGVVNLESVTAKNLGGSDMAFVAHLNNWGEVTLNVEKSTLESTYIAVRAFNSGNDMNNITIKNSTLKGKYCFWVHNYKAAGDANGTDATLNLDILNGTNTFEYSNNALKVGYPILYGFAKPIYVNEENAGIGINEDGNYFIFNSEGLKWLATTINDGDTFKDKTIKLAADIDLNNEQWTSAGTEEHPFSGTFDGDSKTIMNLSVIESEAKEGKAFIGLFGYAKNATIKNVTFENVNLNIACLDIDHSQGHIGAVAGSLEGTSTIENVTVKGDIKVEATFDANGASRVAVVAGGNSNGNVTMKNVHVQANEGSYLKANNNVGALAGQLQVKNVFENCSSNIDVTAKKFFAGGLIGLAAGNSTFTNCHTTGNVTVTAGREGKAHDHYRVGGIAGGWADNVKTPCVLTQCSYTGQLSGTNADGSVAKTFDYAGYVGRGYTLANLAGSTVTIDGVSYVQKYNEVENAGIYIVDGVTPVSTADELIEALENTDKFKGVKFMNEIKIDPANMSNAYGTTGINVKNGQTIDGGGFTLDIKGAGGTWDSGINTTGGIIKNLKVTGSFRGVFINHNSDYSEPVVLENVTIEGTTYTISCDQGLNQNFEATNSTFKGWTSYAATLGQATFTGCNFGAGNGYSFCRPYAPTTFVGCNFEAGYEMDPRAAVTFENCKLDGVALTSENLATLVTSNIANATVK